MTPLLAGALSALFVTIGLLGVPMVLDRGPLERLAGRAGGAPARRSSLVARLVGGLATRLGPRVAPSIRGRQRERIARRLDLAGRPGAITVQRFIGLKAALAALLGGVLALLALAGGSPLLLVLAVVSGWFGPDVWLAREARLRQERIERDLPDFLDILAVTVRAGLGYRAALARVAESLGGPISDEMLTALRQMELGASRRHAFLALRERSTSESLGAFIAAQLQAEELGVPLSEALNEIAEDMRRAAHQNARRRASRAAPRVSLIVTTLIVPGAMILILVSLLLGSDLPDSGLLGGVGGARVAERIRSRGPGGAGGWLENACKLILAARAGILLLTLISLTGEDDRNLVALLLIVAAAASFVPLRWWDRVGPALVRHPAYLAAELMLAALILLLTPVQSPFFYFTLGTALFGGLLYGYSGAAVFSLLLVAVYVWSLDVRAGVEEIPETFQTYVGLPALYPLVAAAGAAARRLLDRQAEAESELAEEQGRAAAEAERARLARDMHDSLAKTVSGIGFAALALSRRIERDPQGAVEEARRLADDARQATRQAREIIVGLRADSGESLPLASALAMRAQSWAEETGVELQLAIEEVGDLHPQTARELEWILGEALANCKRHARATRVGVRLRRLGARAVLTVVDDGAGFEVPDELEDLAGGRHFGVGGMRERALLAGGDLSLESSPGDGCVLSVWVPTEIVPREARNIADAEGGERATRLAGETDVRGRSVPGYTWQ